MRYVVILVLKSEGYAKPAISALIEMGLFESTVLDGEGVENVATETIPVLSEITALFGQDIVFNKTIITVVPDRDTVFEIERSLKRDGIDLHTPDVGTLLAFPCEIVIGADDGSS